MLDGWLVNTTRLTAVLLAVTSSGCSFIQPTARGAPIADTVGAVLAAGSGVGAIAGYQSPTGVGDFTQDSGYSAGVATLWTLAALYTLSAIYGFSQDPKTQRDERILGLQILALGLAGFASGYNGASGGGHSGCCSWHQGIAGCSDGRIVCNDGEFSPSCTCDE